MSESKLVSQMTLSGFQFSAIPINDQLTSTEYMIGEIAVDLSGSMGGYERNLESMLGEITTLNKKLPTAQRIMQRVSAFNNRVWEIHGTRLVTNIDPLEYKGTLKTSGTTALNDAALYCIESSEKYCRDLMSQDYDASAVIFVLTDGGENASSKAKTTQKIADAIGRIKKDEFSMTSLTTCLIGFNDKEASAFEKWSKDAGFDVFLNMKDVTPSSLGKACNLISQSFSSASKNIGSKNTSAVLSQMKI
jgi:hypothetical protein